MKIVGKNTFFLYLNACNKVCKVLLEVATFMVCGDLGEPVERAEQTLTGSHCRQEQADVQQSVRFKGRSIRLAKYTT